MASPIPAGMEDVGEPIGRAAHVLIGLDYDGTLTPIVDDPDDALLPEPMRHILSALNRRQDVAVAVISGRAHADLQKRVGLPGIYYASNHGMEISGPDFRFVEPGAQASSVRLHGLAQDLTGRLAHVAGIFVEDKGLTLSVHYRLASPVVAEEVWHTVNDAVAPLHDLFHVTLGNKVYEIRPMVPWHKGSALTWISARINKPNTFAIYIGDDTTDEDVFRSLSEDAVTIRVGDNAETAARLLLPEPAAVEHFLQWVNELRESSPTS